MINENFKIEQLEIVVEKYNIDFLPSYILSNHARIKMCVIENDVHFSELDMDQLFYNNEIQGVIFCKNINVEKYIIQENYDYGPLIIVLGNVVAKNIYLSGADAFIRGNINVEQNLICGIYNHGEVRVYGEIYAELILSLDHFFDYTTSQIKQGMLIKDDNLYSEIQNFIDEVLEYNELDREALINPIKKGISIHSDKIKKQ